MLSFSIYDYAKNEIKTLDNKELDELNKIKEKSEIINYSFAIVADSVTDLLFKYKEVIKEKTQGKNKKKGLKMKAGIIQEFKGKINGIEFDDKNVYSSTEFILGNIEDKFGETYNDKFIRDLKETIERMELKYDEFRFASLENDFSNCIEKAEKFKNIEFKYSGSDWKIERLNENIKNNLYSLEKTKNKRESREQER